jgi:hypothetical protein
MNFINLKNDVYDSWNPTSWVNYSQSQLPNYEDKKALENSIKFLKNAKHLVFESEISLLQSFISDAAKGKIFLLHAGDCAETFESCTNSNVIKRVSHLKSLATLLEKHLNDFVSKNSFDYFIHKDLGGFLNRELDFYIKNECPYGDGNSSIKILNILNNGNSNS